jgi:Arc/MetJ-type ribon-helix-helix transcriptional regulator
VRDVPAVGALLTPKLPISTLRSMEVQLTPDQRAFVRQAIENGRLRFEEDAVKEALSLWEVRERTRMEILADVDEAESSLLAGEGRPITKESMRDLAEEVKRRGRVRLAAETRTPR